jgi:hypothetical protein
MDDRFSQEHFAECPKFAGLAQEITVTFRNLFDPGQSDQAVNYAWGA